MIGPLETFIVLLCYVLPAILVARYAAKKGHNLWVFLLLGLVASWVISLIVALVVEDKRDAATPTDDLDRLKKLSELRDAGALTEAEFEAQKAQVLGHQQGDAI